MGIRTRASMRRAVTKRNPGDGEEVGGLHFGKSKSGRKYIELLRNRCYLQKTNPLYKLKERIP